MLTLGASWNSSSAKKEPGKRYCANYPWEQWFAKGRFKLVHGKHFHCTLSGMTINVRQAAKRLGLRVRIEQGWSELTVIVKDESK